MHGYMYRLSLGSETTLYVATHEYTGIILIKTGGSLGPSPGPPPAPYPNRNSF